MAASATIVHFTSAGAPGCVVRAQHRSIPQRHPQHSKYKNQATIPAARGEAVPSNEDRGKHMEALTFKDCFRDAWTDAANVVRNRPVMMFVAVAGLVVCGAISLALSHTPGAAARGSAVPLLLLPVALVRVAILTALPVQVIQQILRGGTGRTSAIFGWEFWRYLGFGVLLGIGAALVAAVLGVLGYLAFLESGNGHAPLWVRVSVVGLITVGVLLYGGCRMSLMFCHIATGGPMRWRASWQDTRGHVWRIIVSHFLTLLPIQIASVGLGIAAAFWVPRGDAGTLGYLLELGSALFWVAALTVGGACSCWLYKRLAHSFGARFAS
jgi:hypothetical protein